MEHNTVDPSIALMDYCNRRIFRYQTREFKQIILETLMSMAKQTNKYLDYSFASFALQELMHLFVNAPQCLIMDDDINPIDEDGKLDLAILQSYVNRQCSMNTN